jgi:hypothetical protein
MRLDRKGVPKDNIVGAPLVRWQSGDVADCKSAYAGSIPARTSIKLKFLPLPDNHQ